MSRTVAELLVDTLARLGVEHVFGVVGDALNPFTHALDGDDRIEWIGVRHEEGGALAAAGQAKLTGRLGVCCGTTGPGGNHLVAGLYEARKDHAPVLAITGGVPAAKRGTDHLQEDDVALLFRDVAVYSQVIAAPEQAPGVIREAIAAAYAERGVAHINVPPDVFSATIREEVPSLPVLRPRPEVAPDLADIEEAARLIGEADTVAIFCGHGCLGAASELEQLAERLKAPLMHTYRGKPILPFDHPNWIGGVGLIGSKAGVDAINDADLLLMLGTDYPYSEFLPKHGHVIQIDERALALGRRAPVSLGIIGSVRPALRQLLEHLPARMDNSFLAKAQSARAEWNAMLDQRADRSRTPGKLHPPALARAISDHAADDAIIVTDTGEVTLWAANWWRQTGRQLGTGSFNNAAVGTGLGLANGAQLLNRNRQVIAHIGDGGMTMLLGEFMTSVEHRLPVKIVVYDNAAWGLVHIEMESAGLPAASGTTFPNIDFAAFARACGAEGFTVRDPAMLDETIARFLSAPGPAILHAHVDPDELPTMPHIEPAQVARFGIAKVREAWRSLRRGEA
ncbi:pyruvate dehydrogenase [Sphingobium sp. BHU LFT2]|uniref:thiamine pyrophosphate-binding protein n=1 Tax=Sphingobium sp. BHU LFT2 TaxID=2807634 RepID=UPI001BED0FD5|nr:thiamine pyrophosphate-binding protein [Sphingobium sp. BHU LFT2]MBT2246098.1 pyruvate dehydrogenase [Sphingobium sp. BHU LFT2]